MPRKRPPAKIRPQITIQNNPPDDTYWYNEIQELMKKGYSYKIAYELVSKKKIQELFEKDVRVNSNR